MFNEAAVDSANTSHSVSGELRTNSLLAVERELAPSTALADGERLDALAERIAMHIESFVPHGRMRCLELGCGDAPLVDAIRARSARTDWSRVDVDRASLSDGHAIGDSWALPYGDGEFDVVLLCDVLHDAPENAARLLAEAARVASRVLIKDRFARRPQLKAAQWSAGLIGADRRSTGLPVRYFTREAFVWLAAAHRLVITALDCDLLPQRLRAVRTPRADEHFIAALSVAERPSRHALGWGAENLRPAQR
jgi:SAM-dependent methyltransferase